jgi:hypothetical protein
LIKKFTFILAILLLVLPTRLFQAPKEFIRFTQHDEADALLNNLDEYPHAFVLACIMDRQIKAERAWMIPFHFQEKIGDFSMAALKALSSADIHRLMAEHEPDTGKKILFQKTYQMSKPCKQRNPRALAEAMSLAMSEASAKIINDVYENLADRI